MRIKAKPMREPFGGHHMKAHDQTFKGKSYNEVVSMLAAYRINNSIVLGDPDKDVLEYYAKEFPWMVENEPAPQKPMPVGDYLQWRSWIHGLWKNPPKKLITSKEAEGRWAICAKCPMNIALPKDSADPKELVDLKRKTFILRRGLTTPETLGYCSLHKCDLSIFTFTDNAIAFSAKQEDTEKVPDCWVRSLAADVK